MAKKCKKLKKIKALNTMSIYSHNYGVSLVQDYIDDKSNEIPMGSELIITTHKIRGLK